MQHADDIRTARKALFLNYDEEFYLSKLKVGECIVKVKNRIEPCLVKTPLIPVKDGLITDDWLKANNLNNMFWKYSWKDNSNYLSLKNRIGATLSGKSILENCSENKTINKSNENTPGYFQEQFRGNTSVSGFNSGKSFSKVGGKSSDNNKSKKENQASEIEPSHRLLIDIYESPFSSITQRYKRLNLHLKLGNKCRKKLILENCIRSRKVITGKGWITLFELTQKGRLVLRDLGYEVKNTREGIAHKFWKHKVAEYYKRKGLKVFVEEYFVNGRPDIIVFNNGKKVALEIETGKSNIIYNIEKCLKAGFDEVVCVATSKRVEGKIREELELKKIIDDRLKVMNVFGF